MTEPTDCQVCKHPLVVHGGFARPDGGCAYQGCKCPSAAYPNPTNTRRKPL